MPDDSSHTRGNTCATVESDCDPVLQQSATEKARQDSPEHIEERSERQLDDLTLAELFERFLRSPLITWRRTRTSLAGVETVLAPAIPFGDRVVVDSQQDDARYARRKHATQTVMTAQNLQFIFFGIAVVCAVAGTHTLLGSKGVSRTAPNTLEVGAPFLLLAFFIWLIGEAIGHYEDLRIWWQQLGRYDRIRWLARIAPLATWLTALQAIADSMTAPKEQSFEHLQIAAGRLIAGLIAWYVLDFVIWRIRARLPAPQVSSNDKSGVALSIGVPQLSARSVPLWKRFRTGRIGLAVFSALASALLWLNTSGNRIEPPFIVLWIVTSFAWAMVFAPANWNAFDWCTKRIDRLRRVDWRGNHWVVIAFILIMILGVSFRLTDLDSIPREMTSDHVEKIQDAYRVFNGDYKIFFSNNGGREPVQMYLLSILSTLPGLGFNFFTLKFLAVLESIITLPILFWMGIELLGDNRPRFNKAVALLLMALVASSYWHVIISRQGLRIPLTPAVTALVLIYLARAMRFNRRSDYIKAALALGFGLYMYQAVRMLPVLVVIGVLSAIWMRGVSRRRALLYLVNLAILAFVSLMVFLPMLHFWLEFPNSFWMRTSTRILGDHLAYATVEDVLTALRTNVPVLMHNIRNALLMYNWKGDIGWFNGAPEHPVLDTLTGAFLILGAAAWLTKMVKSRDPVVWFMPVVILVMLMPSALSLAHPEANPSNSRALGTVPIVYLLAALPVATLAAHLNRVIGGRRGMIAAIALGVGIVLMANHQNSETYFDRYASAYTGPSFPHSEAGRIVRGFATSDGAIGNAWSVGYPYWWDYRALGIEAGYPLWPNDMHPLEDLPRKLRDALQRSGTLRLDPNRDLLFLFNPADEQAWQQLSEWFPQGRATTVQSYQPEDRFVLYRVPALGEASLDAFLARNGQTSG